VFRVKKSKIAYQIQPPGTSWGIVMVLSKRFKYFLIAGGMSFLFLASLHAESIDKRINHPIVDNIHERNADGSSLKADQVLITPDQFLDAVQRGSFEIVKIALVQGMDINVQNETAESALHLVKDVALAKYLIARGANVNLPDRQFGMTPLFFQEVAVARLLVAAGASVNAVSRKGNTPIIWYAYSNYLEGIKYLVSAGADINAVNHDGKTVLDVAEGFGGPEVIEYLRSVGAEKRYGK